MNIKRLFISFIFIIFIFTLAVFAKTDQYQIQGGIELNTYSEKKIYKDYNYKITVPADSMLLPYELNDILAEGIDNATDSDIVMLDGEPLVLSDISDKGYVTYFAKAKGVYSIGNYQKSYLDIESHWGREYIEYLSQRKLFNGTSLTEFSPDIAITKGMFITVIGRMHGVDTKDFVDFSSYADVDCQEYYAPYIEWAKQNNIFSSQNEIFEPDTPITRGEMALVISNYIKYCKYDFQYHITNLSFEDINNCTDEVKNAIMDIQKLRIINGRTPQTFQPYGSCTRAEACTVLTRLIKSILGVFYFVENDVDFEDEIYIGCYSNFDIDVLDQEMLNAYADAGFNTLLMGTELRDSAKADFVFNFCDSKGINVVVTDFDNLELHSLEFFDRPSFYGSLIFDEIGMADLETLSSKAKEDNEKIHPKKTFSNLLPLYSNKNQLIYGANADYPGYYPGDYEFYKKYCDAYTQNINSDVLMTSIFPFTRQGIYQEHLEAIAIVSDIAQKNNKEFWCMLQSDSSITDKKQILYQFYYLLAFGCKGFIMWPWAEGLCDANSNLAPAYYAAMSANEEINAVADIINKYELQSTVVYNTKKEYNSVDFPNIQHQTEIIKELRCDNTIVVGVFEYPQDNKKCMILLNTDISKNATVTFKSEGEFLNAYFDGQQTIIEKNHDGCFTVNLEDSQGVLITFE